MAVFDRSSHRRCSVRKGFLRNFATVTGKRICQSLFLNKIAGWACNFIKKETLAQVFYCEFCEISKNTFSTEYLWTTASKQRATCFIKWLYVKSSQFQVWGASRLHAGTSFISYLYTWFSSSNQIFRSAPPCRWY